ncbi:hypothetical protein [Gracilibacillus suaedae]|uniref:hypothetical protein n=1 Tax=Gracilibacillus suaedae TaxID=2820273 RepID=UPI001ABDD73A|nr:hypothetical protein [Gracilibacillus suaedae]
MDQHDQFFRLLKEVKRKLWIQALIHSLYLALTTCAGITLLWILASRFFVIPFLENKIVITIGIVIVALFLYLVWKRPTNLDAVRKLDQQDLDDRVMTTYHFMDETSAIAKLQRKDTLNKMKEVLPAIKQKKIDWFQWKKLAVTGCLLLLSYLGMTYPNEVMETAKDKEKEIEIVEENKENIEQFTETHREAVGKEAEKELDELLEEVDQAKQAEEINKELLKAEEQLNELKEEAETSQNQLNQLSEQLRQEGLNNLAQATSNRNVDQMEKQMAELQEQLDDFSEEELQALQEKLQSIADAMGKDSEALAEGTLSKEQLEEFISNLEGDLKELVDSAGNEAMLAEAQQNLQQLASNMNKQMTTAGITTPGSLSFSSGSSSSGNSSEASGQSAENDQQEGSRSQSGSESGSNSGSGSGSRSGNGSGSGTGSGSGSGAGNGAGLGDGNRQLSVPQNLDGEQNQEIDNGELSSGPSEQQIAPSAPILPGEVRSYEEVYQHYENTYRQALDRNDYPDHLQEIIKEYFSDIKPAEEN